MEREPDSLGVGGIDPVLVRAAIEEAGESGVALAQVSLNRVARRAGVSRATLFRRVGSRAALEEAVRRTGVDPGRRESVRERALAAALDVVEQQGLDAMTLEEVARRAGCAVTSVHTQLGGRDGLLSALFERYSPIAVGVRRLLDDLPLRFEDQVRAVYGAFYDAAVQHPALTAALVADVLGRPDGPMAGVARRRGVPLAMEDLGGWLAEEASKGHCRRLAPALAVPILLGPLALHMLTRPLLAGAGAEVPDRAAAIEALTGAFCRGMAIE